MTPPAPRPLDLINTDEAARLLGITRGHLRRWILGGKLTAYRTGKRYWVSRGDVEKLWKPVA